MKKIKNENDFLGYLIKNSKNNVCNQHECYKESGLDQSSFIYYANILKDKHYIETDVTNYYITQIGINNYISPVKKFALSFLKFSVLTLKELLVFLSGIVSGILVAYFIHLFGLQ